MPFKLTPEQREKIAEIVGADNKDKVFDEDHVVVIETERNSAVQNLSENQAVVDKFKGKVAVTEAESKELLQLRVDIKKKPSQNPEEELTNLRTTLAQEHQAQIQTVNLDKQFWEKETKDLRGKNALIAAANSLGFKDTSDAVDKLLPFIDVQVIGEGDERRTEAVVLDSAKRKRFNNAGQPMKPEELVAELAKSKPYLVDEKKIRGGGTGGGEGDDNKRTNQSTQAELDSEYEKAKVAKDDEKMMEIDRRRAALVRSKQKQGV